MLLVFLILGVRILMNVRESSRKVLHISKFLCLVTIFKNEADTIQEWIEHYRAEGVDHIFAINDGSDDDWEPKVRPFTSFVTVVNDTVPHQQSKKYNKYFLQAAKEYEWVIVADLDEYLYGRPNTLAQELKNIQADYVRVQWKMFGSNGHIQQPHSIRHGFTRRNYIHGNVAASHYKSIIRTNKLLKLGIHDSETINTPPAPHGTFLCSGLRAPDKNHSLNLITTQEQELNTFPIHLNHYPIQSQEWFQKVKMKRGDVNTKTSDNIRNMDYFRSYDNNQVIDEELSTKY